MPSQISDNAVEARSQKPEARSQKPEARSQKPEARSQKPASSSLPLAHEVKRASSAHSSLSRTKSKPKQKSADELSADLGVAKASGAKSKVQAKPKPKTKPKSKSKSDHSSVQVESKSRSQAKPTTKLKPRTSLTVGRLIKSKRRVKDFGEVFTPESIVQQMCDLCEPDISAIDKKVFEPTCGNGNFLVEILRRKLRRINQVDNPRFDLEVIWSLSNIYGVDIQLDNVQEARQRLESVVLDFIAKYQGSTLTRSTIAAILNVTIIVGDTLRDKDTLHFYDFQPNFDAGSFEVTKYSLKDIERDYANCRRISLADVSDGIAGIFSPSGKPKSKPKPLRSPRHNSQLMLLKGISK